MKKEDDKNHIIERLIASFIVFLIIIFIGFIFVGGFIFVTNAVFGGFSNNTLNIIGKVIGVIVLSFITGCILIAFLTSGSI